MHDPWLDPQRIDDDPVVRLEFDEVEPAERSRVLVLLAAAQGQIDPFDVEGEPGDLVFAERRADHLAQGLHHGDHEGGRGAETRAQGAVHVGADRQRNAPAAVELLHHPPVDAAVQPQTLVQGDAAGRIEFVGAAEIGCLEVHEAVVTQGHRGQGVAVDGHVEHAAAVGVGIGRNVGAPAGQPQAQRRARPDRLAHCRSSASREAFRGISVRTPPRNDPERV